MMKSIKLNDRQITNFINKTNYLKHDPPHQYEHIRIHDNNITCILYNSGKLVYEANKQTTNLLNTIGILNKNQRQNFDKHYNKDYKINTNSFDNSSICLSDYEYTIGSDETGKGEWYGPLVVTAVATSNDENIKLRKIGVKDSKKLNKKQISTLYKKIDKLNIKHESIILRPYSYNKLYNKFKSEGKNLNHLLAYLHSKVITLLLKEINSNDTLIIIDKFDAKKMNQYINTQANIIQESNGEKYTPVATSSIIAKYHYEKTLNELEERYNINLSKKTKAYEINKNILDKVSKTHFKNINKYL